MGKKRKLLLRQIHKTNKKHFAAGTLIGRSFLYFFPKNHMTTYIEKNTQYKRSCWHFPSVAYKILETFANIHGQENKIIRMMEMTK